jgi:hypothetical protein
MSQELKEEILKAVLDCDGDLDRMNVDKIIDIVISMQTQSLFMPASKSFDEGNNIIYERMQKAREKLNS